jgi:galactofuranose transport system substrate-binding protein
MKISHVLSLLVILIMLLEPTGCAPDSRLTPTPQSTSNNTQIKPKKTYADVIVGFAQLGAESEWRVANTKSIQETAKQLGVELRFSDAQQSQQKQIEAVRKLIIQKVDVIGISPIVETGWEEGF